MKTYLARYWAVYGISLVAPALAACGDSGDVATEAATDTQGTTNEVPTTGSATEPGGSTSTTDVPTSTSSNSDGNTSSTGASDPTTSGTTTDTTGGVSVSSTSAGSTTGGDVCMTILCGDPPVCCLDTEECVGGACAPICDSGVRCGDNQEMCCADGDVCVGDSCTTPLGDCNDSYDCNPGNYCEPVLKKCLPQPDPLQCEVVPSFDKIDVQLEWSWTVNEVTVTPMVADVQGDAVPEVVVNAHRIDGIDRNRGEIVLLDGKTGVELWRLKEDPNNSSYGSFGLGTPVLGDVNGDLKPDIVYPGRYAGNPQPNASPNNQTGFVHAVDGTGKHLWTGHTANNTPVLIRWSHAAAVMVNLDNDPEAEIAIGGALFDNDGLMVWNEQNKGGALGTPTDNKNPPSLLYTGGLATFADLTGDGKPELITGREAWTINWAPGNPPVVSLTQLWKNTDGKGNDGWPSVGDIDQNGTPEVILVAWPDIKVLDGKTGKLWCGIDPTGVMCNGNDMLRTQPIPIRGGNLGGPATIADFDGDGKPEAGIAGGLAYAVYDFNRKNEVIVVPMGEAAPVAGAMFVRWARTTQDNSSACTGSSVFDFQGDGPAEVAYQDECKVYVYDGSTGTSELEILNSSGTVHEYPLVVDADGDGNAEFLTVANLAETKTIDACKVKIPNYQARKGVYSYGAGTDNWVPTRKVWTQHTYHVTNAESDGNVPLMEQDNWTTPGLNNFRQNVQGEGVFNAADLTASLAVSLDKCGNELVLQATIYNEGALGVPAGIDVTFYEGIDNTGLKLGTKPTSEALLTGGSTKVSWTVDAPPQGQKKNYFVEVDGGGGIVQECNEDNNGALVTDAECPTPG
ncbi:MAG: hypothetical protein IPO88_32560 [Nannocystis sp.]|uniref:hypothetical protein n=1 Tax=Nannocystis sp. TaxID=1962667 RepID=UPI0024240477|nr:hypothetical protein [Nannocystis sp.]MBK9758166.1 hypothetical protein [Nannocystis sp.]